jgi:hypothetical protein
METSLGFPVAVAILPASGCATESACGLPSPWPPIARSDASATQLSRATRPGRVEARLPERDVRGSPVRRRALWAGHVRVANACLGIRNAHASRRTLAIRQERALPESFQARARLHEAQLRTAGPPSGNSSWNPNAGGESQGPRPVSPESAAAGTSSCPPGCEDPIRMRDSLLPCPTAPPDGTSRLREYTQSRSRRHSEARDSP